MSSLATHICFTDPLAWFHFLLLFSGRTLCRAEDPERDFGFLESSSAGSFKATSTYFSELICPKKESIHFSWQRWQLKYVPPGWSIGEHFFLSIWHFMQELHGLPMVAINDLSIGGLWWNIKRICMPKRMVDWQVNQKSNQFRLWIDLLQNIVCYFFAKLWCMETMIWVIALHQINGDGLVRCNWQVAKDR